MKTGVLTAAQFDFDEWAKLARENPDEFERRRRAAIDALIASAPERSRRLQGTQWRLDRERELAHTPLKACLRISAMMWESFLEMKSGLEDIANSVATMAPSRSLELVNPAQAEAASAARVADEAANESPSAKVLPFTPAATRRNPPEESA
jgi:hypothetical protein